MQSTCAYILPSLDESGNQSLTPVWIQATPNVSGSHCSSCGTVNPASRIMSAKRCALGNLRIDSTRYCAAVVRLIWAVRSARALEMIGGEEGAEREGRED